MIYIFTIDTKNSSLFSESYFENMLFGVRKNIPKRNYANSKDYIQSLLWKIAIIKLAKSLFNKVIHVDDISYNEYGKPYIKDFLEFSISHTVNCLVICISERKVGIDVESLKLNLYSVDFYYAWTSKEAFIKYMGKGLSVIPLSEIYISNLENHKKIEYCDISASVHNILLGENLISLVSKLNEDYMIFQIDISMITRL